MSILAVEQNKAGDAVVTARSGMTGEQNTRTLPLSKQSLMRGLADRANGASIQQVFPGLSDDDREFLMTGITPEEWDAAFDDDREEDW